MVTPIVKYKLRKNQTCIIFIAAPSRTNSSGTDWTSHFQEAVILRSSTLCLELRFIPVPFQILIIYNFLRLLFTIRLHFIAAPFPHCQSLLRWLYFRIWHTNVQSNHRIWAWWYCNNDMVLLCACSHVVNIPDKKPDCSTCSFYTGVLSVTYFSSLSWYSKWSSSKK